MNITDLIKAPQASERPSFGDWLAEFLPWARALLALPFVLPVLMLSGPFLFLVTLVVALVVALVAVAILVALSGVILATPYLLIRHVHRRLAERRRSPKRAVPIQRVIAHPGFAEGTTVGGAQ